MITITREDNMELMAMYPDNYFDLAIVDPPYGILNKTKRGGDYKFNMEEYSQWDVKPNNKYFEELFRVSKNQIIWGANHFAGLFDSSSPCWIVWDKVNGASTFADAELAYASFDTAVRVFKYMWNGMHQGSFGGDVRKNDKRIHPTQKPVPLYEWLLLNYAKPGQKILDTHLGSGSSAIACNNMGFEMVGCELDIDYYHAACERVDEYAKQERLFA